MFSDSRFAQFTKRVRLRLTKLAPPGPLAMSTDPSEESSEKPKRRAGRQKQTTPRQTHVISVRLTDAEYAELATESDEYKLSMGEVLRAVWRGTPDEARARKPLTPDEMALRRQLIGMASNLNQITKQLHASPDVREEARQALAKLNHLLTD